LLRARRLQTDGGAPDSCAFPLFNGLTLKDIAKLRDELKARYVSVVR
jgi:hypothetical protein